MKLTKKDIGKLFMVNWEDNDPEKVLVLEIESRGERQDVSFLGLKNKFTDSQEQSFNPKTKKWFFEPCNGNFNICDLI